MKKEAQIIVTDELEALKQRIINNIRNNGQNASGRTIASLSVTPPDDIMRLMATGDHAPFGTLETGRRGGNVPQNFQSIILQWMEDKGIAAAPMPYIRKPSAKWQPKYTPEERGRLSLAAAIAATIKKSGTKLHRTGGRNDVYSSEIPTSLQKIKEQLSILLKSEVIKSIKLN